MPCNLSYIQAFLNRPGIEGPRRTRGYIPARPGDFHGKASQDAARYTAIGASGVTVATGCDLGQTDAPTLRAYGLEPAIVSQLLPYMGKKRGEAIALLQRLPLIVSPETAQAIDAAVRLGYLQRFVRPAYETAAGVCVDHLPDPAQAVVFSCCFQKGCAGVRRDWPILWGHFTRRDWMAAARELRHGFTQYAARRRMEGELLATMVASKERQSGQACGRTANAPAHNL